MRIEYEVREEQAEGLYHARGQVLRQATVSPVLFVILQFLASPAGLEPATLCLEGRCSIHLSYGLVP